jgi:hypothetical protein
MTLCNNLKSAIDAAEVEKQAVSMTLASMIPVGQLTVIQEGYLDVDFRSIGFFASKQDKKQVEAIKVVEVHKTHKT